jgi:hypothetical protein
MMWVPVILACVTGMCDFVHGDVYWSAKECEQVLDAAMAELAKLEIVSTGVCIQIKVS